MKTQRKLMAAAGLASVLALAGCWGDKADDVAAVVPPVVVSTEVPDSAGVSVAAFFSYILSLSVTDDSSEPLTLKDTFAVPADETSEPTPLV